ncbi:hypothetical protein [Mycobacteroides abscessus]|uniref:hypothetical protein n=1 Tax=Mycobacteroides abscessus TaxID=36809 RepID=UPI0009A70DAB|nr:hypothetical protein [Mycobacteroides abscessus]SLH39246.1 Uncharacterised protein [Mycobacteroides abscessus subsp. massiliense]
MSDPVEPTVRHPHHAKLTDLPGYPCPPRVRDIAHRENSWGYIGIAGPVTVATIGLTRATVVHDELGHLWANGDVVPEFKVPNESNYSPGAIVYCAPTGLGLWIHPKSLRALPSASRLDLQEDDLIDIWLPVNEVTETMPAAAAKHAAEFPETSHVTPYPGSGASEN